MFKTDQIVMLTRALLVIQRTPAIRAWLKVNDPKALKQVDNAIQQSGYDPDKDTPGWPYRSI